MISIQIEFEIVLLAMSSLFNKKCNSYKLKICDKSFLLYKLQFYGNEIFYNHD
jgi:hypothetical protein